jgi:hypothetical protein
MLGLSYERLGPTLLQAGKATLILLGSGAYLVKAGKVRPILPRSKAYLIGVWLSDDPGLVPVEVGGLGGLGHIEGLLDTLVDELGQCSLPADKRIKK